MCSGSGRGLVFLEALAASSTPMGSDLHVSIDYGEALELFLREGLCS